MYLVPCIIASIDTYRVLWRGYYVRVRIRVWSAIKLSLWLINLNTSARKMRNAKCTIMINFHALCSLDHWITGVWLPERKPHSHRPQDTRPGCIDQLCRLHQYMIHQYISTSVQLYHSTSVPLKITRNGRMPTTAYYCADLFGMAMQWCNIFQYTSACIISAVRGNLVLTSSYLAVQWRAAQEIRLSDYSDMSESLFGFSFLLSSQASRTQRFSCCVKESIFQHSRWFHANCLVCWLCLHLCVLFITAVSLQSLRCC